MTRPRLTAGTKTGVLLPCDMFSFSFRIFVSLGSLWLKIPGGKNDGHKGHEVHKDKMRSRLTK